MGLMSRRKGKCGEREIVVLARVAGFDRAERTAAMQAHRGNESDHADVANIGRLFAEVKRHRRVNVQKAVKELLSHDRPGLIRVVFHRDNGGPWLVTLEAEELLKLERDAGSSTPTEKP